MKEEISILLHYEPYIAYLIQRCKIRYTDKVPTAGVRIMPGGVIELLVNPEFYHLQTQPERVGLLWHEMYHLLSDHISRSYGLDPHSANVAMDEAINQVINPKFLPKKAILPEYFRHEKHLSFEEYYILHLKRGDAAKFQQKKNYEGGVDDEQNKKEIKEKIKNTLEKQKELQDQQEQQQGEQEKKDQGSKKDAQDQKDLAKKEDGLEDKQELISEKMSNNGMHDEAQQSEDLSERQKDLRNRMQDLQKDYDKKDSDGQPDDSKNDDQKDGSPRGDQQKQAEMQAQQEELQKELEEALDKLDKINQDEKKRQQQKAKGQGQGQGQGEPGEGSGGGEGDEDAPEVMDNHDMWHETAASESEQKMALSNILSQAMQDTERTHGPGSVPQDIRKLIEKTIAKPKINWKVAFRGYVGRSLTTTSEQTRRRPHRVHDILAPGKKSKLGPTIIYAIDCSGSVREEEYLTVLLEVVNLSKEFKDKVEVIFFDTQVFESKALIDPSIKKLPARPLHGGTDFQCVVDYAKERAPDLLIIATDGEAPTPTRPRFPVLWAIFGGKDHPEHFGKRVMIESEGSKPNSKILGS